MKKLLIPILIFAFQFAHAQIEVDYEGYRYESKIKGPKHKRSKVLEIMVGNNGNYFVASYAGPKRYITVQVYELYTWELVGSYKFKGRAELYNSYFDDVDNIFYINSDIFKNRFIKLDLDTGDYEEVKCEQTPRGCEKLEPEVYKTELFTIGENYYITRDEERKNYIKVYKKKELFIDEMEYLEDDSNH